MKTLRLIASTVAGAAIAAAQAQFNARDDFVLVGDIAYGMMPPETICGGIVESLGWSPSGRFLVAHRTEVGPAALLSIVSSGRPPTEDPRVISVVLYSVADRKATIAWQAKASVARLTNLQWLGGNPEMALALVEERMRATDPDQPLPTRLSLIGVDAAKGSSRLLYRAPEVPDGEVELVCSPSKPLALLIESTIALKPGSDAARPSFESRSRFLLVSSGGVVRPVAGVDPEMGFAGWTSDGGSAYLRSLKRTPQGRIANTLFTLDLTTGAVTPASKPQGAGEMHIGDAKLIAVQAGTAAQGRKTQRQLVGVWLREARGESEALIAADATAAEVSPNLDGVAYISQGAALMRPIIQVPKAVYLSALEAAERSRLLSNVKQIGTAALMYANDMDDVLPGSDAKVSDLFLPYLANARMLDGFVYTFAGGSLKDVKDPAGTVLGYIQGPGGRAIVYTDGHAKWMPDK